MPIGPTPGSSEVTVFSGQSAYPSALTGDARPTGSLSLSVANGGDASGNFTGGHAQNVLIVEVLYTLQDT